MRSLAFALVLALSTGCTATRWAYVYAFDAWPPEPRGGIEIRAEASPEGVTVVVVNTSSATARVIWERSTLVDTRGESHALLVSGQKYNDAGRTVPPMVIAPGSKGTATMVPADKVRLAPARVLAGILIPGGWVTDPLVPVESTNTEAEDRSAAQVGGASMRLVLHLEHPGLARPDVEVGFTVVGISRMRCTNRGGIPQGCEEAGEIYPQLTATPAKKKGYKDPSRRTSSANAAQK